MLVILGSRTKFRLNHIRIVELVMSWLMTVSTLRIETSNISREIIKIVEIRFMFSLIMNHTCWTHDAKFFANLVM